MVALALALNGCAEFDDSPRGTFVDNPPLGAGPEPTPQIPGEPTPPGEATPAPTEPGEPLGPCDDPDPAVVATCLEPTGGVAVLPDGAAALVTERTTGRLLRVTPGAEPTVEATVPVDAAGDGGLLDVALSPSWVEDQLVYLYLSTPTENQVVRLAPGDVPKPVLTGIPRGQRGNGASIAFDAEGNLLVLTGPTDDPAAAADPASGAGALLRLDPGDAPAEGNPTPGSAVLSRDVGAVGGVCTDPATGTSWVADRAEQADRLRAVLANGTLSAPVWTWPDRPGVAACAALQGRVAVSLTGGQSLYVLSTSPENAVLAEPEVLAQDTYGRLAGADVGPDGVVWAGTVNKDGPNPAATDDRVVRIQPPSAGGGGGTD